MTSSFQERYKKLTDKEVVSLIVTPPCNDEAAAYMIYNRYDPLLHKIYYQVFYYNNDWYEDCRDDLLDYLKGKEGRWQRLVSFQWKSKFSTWIGTTAWRRFAEIKPYLIGNFSGALSIDIDDDDEKRYTVQLPYCGVEEYEQRERRILLMEAIGQLKDDDQKFVLLKRLEGYNSQEIADLLQQSWIKHSIEKFDNKGNKVVPSAAYVDVRTQRAKEKLKEYITRNA